MLDDVIAWLGAMNKNNLTLAEQAALWGFCLFICVAFYFRTRPFVFLFRKFKAWTKRRNERLCLEHYNSLVKCANHETKKRHQNEMAFEELKARVELLEQYWSDPQPTTDDLTEIDERLKKLRDLTDHRLRILEDRTAPQIVYDPNYRAPFCDVDPSKPFGDGTSKAGHTAEQARAILAKAGYRWELCDRGELRPRWRVCQDGQFIGVFDHEWELLNTVGGYIGVGPVEPFDDDTPAGGSVPYKPR